MNLPIRIRETNFRVYLASQQPNSPSQLPYFQRPIIPLKPQLGSQQIKRKARTLSGECC